MLSEQRTNSLQIQIGKLCRDRKCDLFSEIDLIFFDTTSITLEGKEGSALGQSSFDQVHRAHRQQMILDLAVDMHGWPISSLT